MAGSSSSWESKHLVEFLVGTYRRSRLFKRAAVLLSRAECKGVIMLSSDHSLTTHLQVFRDSSTVGGPTGVRERSEAVGTACSEQQGKVPQSTYLDRPPFRRLDLHIETSASSSAVVKRHIYRVRGCLRYQLC